MSIKALTILAYARVKSRERRLTRRTFCTLVLLFYIAFHFESDRKCVWHIHREHASAGYRRCWADTITIIILSLLLCVRLCVQKVSPEAIWPPVKHPSFLCISELVRYRSSRSKGLATVLGNHWSKPLWNGGRPKLGRHVRLTLPRFERHGDGEREEFGSRHYPWMLYRCKRFYPKRFW